MILEDEHEAGTGTEFEDSREFRSQRGRPTGIDGARGETSYRCRALLLALDNLHGVENRVDRVTTDILETGGFWQVSGLVEVPLRAALVEIQVHGVRGVGWDIGQAIANWIAAARRRAEGQGSDL